MDFHFLSLFPESLKNYFEVGIISRAIEQDKIKIFNHDLRVFGKGNYRKVDDKVYGGGSGMIIKVDVLVEAIEKIKSHHQIDQVILLSAKGKLFDHQKALNYSKLKSVLLVCGRYEGVDQRAIDLVIDEEVSIGDYILTGGELAAGIIIDSVGRLIPGVIEDESVIKNESYAKNLLEHPQYTRPEEYRGLKVPTVLLSGHHAEIEKWKEQESQKITKKNRPDLSKKSN